jgi:hypothetical protein
MNSIRISSHYLPNAIVGGTICLSLFIFGQVVVVASLGYLLGPLQSQHLALQIFLGLVYLIDFMLSLVLISNVLTNQTSQDLDEIVGSFFAGGFMILAATFVSVVVCILIVPFLFSLVFQFSPVNSNQQRG